MNQAISVVPREGALPEEVDYRDTGCDISPSCLRCPLPTCRYDTTMPAHVMASATRQQKAHIMLRAGVDVDGIAYLLAVSRRQVFRYLEARPAGPG